MNEVKAEMIEENEKLTKTVETQIENEDSKANSDNKKDSKVASSQAEDKDQGPKSSNMKASLILKGFQRSSKKQISKRKLKTRSLKNSVKMEKKPKRVIQEKKKRESNKRFVGGNDEMILRPSSPLLRSFMKPAPKIYKKKQIGQKKFLIHAHPKPGLETESFYGKKKGNVKRNFNTYQTVDFQEESEEEEMSVKFWSKKNMIRSMSSNPRGFARLIGSKINMIDEIQRLVKLDHKAKTKQKKPKNNMFRSVDISLKNRRPNDSLESRKRNASRNASRENAWDPNRDRIVKVGTSSSIWEQTHLKKQIHKEKQKKKKRFKHLIYSSVQVEKSDIKAKAEFMKEREMKNSFYAPLKTSSNLKDYSLSKSKDKKEEIRSSRPMRNTLEDTVPKFQPPFKLEETQEKITNSFLLYKSNSRMMDNADGITVELEEDKSVCLEDMETKLCFFFKKTLVYASKIELLKLKAQKENGEHNIYSLFRQFCDPENGRLTITSLQLLVEILQFPLEEYDISSIMLFLEKFKEVEEDASLELEYGEFRELFVSHKVTTPEIYLFSNWTPEINRPFNLPDSEFYLLRQILMLTSRQIQDVSRIINALKAYTADSLFNYIALFNEENDTIEGHLNNFFYNQEEMEELKESFKVQIDFTSPRVQNQVKSKRPNSAKIEVVGPSFSNNMTSKSFRNPSFAGSPNAEKVIEEAKNAVKEENEDVIIEDTQKESEVIDPDLFESLGHYKNENPEKEKVVKSNYSSLVKPESLLNRYTRYKKRRIQKKKMQENPLGVTNTTIELGNNEEEVNNMNKIIQEMETKQAQANFENPKSTETQAHMIDVSTIRNFLNFHGVMFLEEDLELVMYCMGSAHGILDRDAFKRFFHSPLWD